MSMILKNSLIVQNPTIAQMKAYLASRPDWRLFDNTSFPEWWIYKGKPGDGVVLNELNNNSNVRAIALIENRSSLEVYNAITGANIPSWEAAVLFVNANTETNHDHD